MTKRALAGAWLAWLLAAAPAHGDDHRPWFGSGSAPPLARTTLAMTPPATIRVRILHTSRPMRLGCTGPYDYMALDGGKVQSGHAAQSVRLSKRRIVIGSAPFSGAVIIAPVRPADFLTVNHRRYRGAILIEPLRNGKFDVIEQVGLEEYLYGVLPKEVGSEWPLEALKAQAVVSRTYTLANLAADPGQRFDLTNDVSSQVYGGVESESANTNRAVDDTRGEALVGRDGKPVQTFFHSSCGGRTETPGNVWVARTTDDYFASVADPYCKEDPFYHWELTISASTLRARLRRAGIRVGEIRDLKLAERSPSERVTLFVVKSSTGKREIAGNRFRIAVGPEALRSTLLTDFKRTRRGFHFEGRGWGHGVGLCQWGARGRAKEGQTYDVILSAYYPNVVLARAAVPAP